MKKTHQQNLGVFTTPVQYHALSFNGNDVLLDLEIRLETSLSLHLSLEKYSWSVTINIIKN
jgi:hypothetical protein